MLTLLLSFSRSAFIPAIQKCPMSTRSIAKHLFIFFAPRTQRKPNDSKAVWRFQRSHTGKNVLFGSLFVLTGSLDVTVIPVFCLVLKKKKSLPWKNSADQHFSTTFPALYAAITMPFKAGPFLSPSSMYSLWSGRWKRPTQRWAARSRCAFHMVNSFGWARHCVLP